MHLADKSQIKIFNDEYIESHLIFPLEKCLDYMLENAISQLEASNKKMIFKNQKPQDQIMYDKDKVRNIQSARGPET